jgi:hypothetical protein
MDVAEILELLGARPPRFVVGSRSSADPRRSGRAEEARDMRSRWCTWLLSLGLLSLRVAISAEAFAQTTSEPATAPDDASPDGALPDSVLPGRDLPDADLPDQDQPDGDLPDADLPDQELPSGEQR